MSQITYLITGATRGLGRAFVENYLARPSVMVIAAVRNLDDANAKSLENLPQGDKSKLILVEIEATSAKDAITATNKLKAEGIFQIDIVIANAGIANNYVRVEQTPLHELMRHVDTNAYGPLRLFQAVYPMLMKSEHPKFVGIGSSLGSIAGTGQYSQVPCAAYGPSKAVLHWFVKKIHQENESFVSFVVDPGWVQTDMGYYSASQFGLQKPDLTIEESIGPIINIIDSATREKQGGCMFKWDGTEFPW